MTRHTNAARDLAALLADASPETAALNAAQLAALRAEAAADLAPLMQAGALGGAAPTEHDEQAALFAWAAENEAAHPELRMLHATPNGGYRPIATAVKMQKEGQKRGYPDVSLDVARGRFHGLRIELKRADHSNGPTPEQEEWIARLRYYGYCACICYGCEEAINCIMGYLVQEGA